jgi:hypothetical protein
MFNSLLILALKTVKACLEGARAGLTKNVLF